MSLGATASAPASAWETAVFASSSTVMSLSTSLSRTKPQWPCEVLAEADVGDHGEVGVGLLEGANGHLDDALVVVGARARFVLGGGDAEEQDGGDARGGDLGCLGHQLGDREALDSGHRVDLFAQVFSGHDEEWLDQVRGAEVRLSN